MDNSNTIYDRITDLICEKLENGTNPWKKPFTSPGIFPMNLVSKRPYSGINSFILQCSGFNSPFFLTYNQVKTLGGNVKKGERSTPIIFWKFIESGKSKKDLTEETGSTKRIPLLKHFNVFNIEQTEGIPEKDITPVENFKREFSPIEDAEKIVTGYKNGPEIIYGKEGAYYAPMRDMIGMPDKNCFTSDSNFYSVLFHEMGHSTGHKNRLNRIEPGTAPFGSVKYSFEELVAEMTASFLCGCCGFENETIDNSVAYLKGWASNLRNNPKWMVQASGKAQRAADFIQGIS
ncbi:MAG: DUF1738 domain-containing protein, partial [Peptostreptococcaceae bacterium]|nr:DUF1738 domain-containing protein [Peptostreptococcaceae bacterium]